MTILKKIYILLFFISTLFFNQVLARATKEMDHIKTSMIPEQTSIIETKETGEGVLFFIIKYVKDSIFGVLALIAIGVFIYIGIRLLMARGNPEEFKKVLMHFVYAVVGLTVVALSWGIIIMVSGLNL